MPKFKVVDPKDWTSGFYPGTLWEAYRLTGDEHLRAEAEKFTARLEGIQYYKGTHDLGFMVFCSYGQQQQALHDAHSADVIVEAANSLISRQDSVIGVIRSWDFGEWNYPVIIDNMMNLEMLFWASKHTGDPVPRRGGAPCRHHAAEPLPRGRHPYHVVSYNDDGTVESRGHSRAILTLRPGPGARAGTLRLYDATARRVTRRIGPCASHRFVRDEPSPNARGSDSLLGLRRSGHS